MIIFYTILIFLGVGFMIWLYDVIYGGDK